MPTDLTLSSPHRDFESIKHTTDRKDEFWTARELMPILSYSNWRNFEIVLEKAKRACVTSGQEVTSHFVDTIKKVKLGLGGIREVKDYKLSRYACYLIAQNGDPSKEPIAQAQTYFAIQTRRQELFQNLGEDERRLFIREEIKKQNKQLFSTAKKAGVTDFGKFNKMGYLGLYDQDIDQVKEKKGIGQDDILDRAGSTELAANLFRITQTEEKMKKEEVKGEGRANITHLMVGKKVRDSIKDIGGTMPEDLPPAQHIKEIKSNPGQQKLIK